MAVSACLAAQACDAHLTSVVRRLLHERPGLLSQPWLLGAAAAGAADPGMVCKAYTLGMQVRGDHCTDLAIPAVGCPAALSASPPIGGVLHALMCCPPALRRGMPVLRLRATSS